MFKVGDRVHLIGDPHWGTIKALIYGKERAEVYWEGLGILCQHDFYKLRKAKETTTMDNPFIETVTTKKLKTAVYSGSDINCANVWLKAVRKNSIDLAVCIKEPSYIDYCAFSKKGLGNLLKMPQEVHDLMED